MINIKENILRLRSEGLTYTQIVKQLNCSKGTISYHCGKDQKTKTNIRNIKHKSKDIFMYLLKRKIYNFNYAKPLIRKVREYKQNVFMINLRNKCFKFSNRKNYNKNEMKVTTKDILEKIKQNNKCALSGREIDIQNTNSWELDHIIPSSKGGTNSLDNCQIVCTEANQSKKDLLPEEFLELCKDVLKHNGYEIIKSE